MSALALAALLTAQASGLLVAEGGVLTSRTQIITVQAGGQQTWVETVDLLVTEPTRVALFRALPAPPRIQPLPADRLRPLQALARGAPPVHLDVKAQLFGPSIVSLLVPAAPAEEPMPRRWQNRQVPDWRVPVRVFPSQTGTTALPQDLVSWMAQHEVRPSPAQRALLSAYAARGFALCAGLVQVPRAGWAALGPIAYHYAASSPQLPAAQLAPPGPIDLTVVGATPWLPAGLEVTWGPEAESPRAAGWFHAFVPSGPLSDALAPLGSKRLPDGGHVLRLELATPMPDLELEAAPGLAEIPGPRTRGGLLDVLLSMLLGLSPLLFTPEAWFFAWLGRERRAFRVRPWALYALAVAVFWLLALDGLARAAAVGPAVLAWVRWRPRR